MKTKISKWGNSLALRIPKAIAEDSHLSIGSAVDLSVQSNALVVKSIDEKYTLGDLVSKINDENIHDETDTGEPTGQEVW
ncbi:MAG TPA: AbrB/MazE/SpoVT family DNA-binding domain-containing protein [Spirochaetota bacterium]|nr:AbrB/MazE/SpoVT family DNA-binding domain-containing protein [Spirochaetota bacterium]